MKVTEILISITVAYVVDKWYHIGTTSFRLTMKDLHVRIPDQDHESLRKICIKKELKISEVVRRLIHEFNTQGVNKQT